MCVKITFQCLNVRRLRGGMNIVYVTCGVSKRLAKTKIIQLTYKHIRNAARLLSSILRYCLRSLRTY